MSAAAKKFYEALNSETPLQIMGVINAYSALLAKKHGFKVVYLSGAGIANAGKAVPDIGLTTIDDIVVDADRIVSSIDLPLLVDIDTGWGSYNNSKEAVSKLSSIGAAGIHIEDQNELKKCGHLNDKKIVSSKVMQDRIKACVDGKSDKDFIIMARSDSFASEGINGFIDRAGSYVEAGADMIFAEALPDIALYKKITDNVSVPILANMTEFGKTPCYTVEQFRDSGIHMVLYPLSGFRAMNHAVDVVFRSIRKNGTQKNVIKLMETREELYHNLNYVPDEFEGES